MLGHQGQRLFPSPAAPATSMPGRPPSSRTRPSRTLGPAGQLGHRNQVTLTAITDGLIIMAVTTVVVRTIGLGVRASRLPAAELILSHP